MPLAGRRRGEATRDLRPLALAATLLVLGAGLVGQDPSAECSCPGEGEPWAVPGLGLEMVWLPPGTFRMGSSDGNDDERPVHTVTITKGFWMGLHEVTQAQYEVMKGNNPSRFKGPRNPVETLSWHDALAFTQALTEREHSAFRLPAGYEYRLPTEAEWEYACRAGTETLFSFGDDEASLASYAHCLDWTSIGGPGWRDLASKTGWRATAVVGSHEPNAWGLYDMHGNVWEWCLDVYDAECYAHCGACIADPVRADGSEHRVIRGGDWSGSPDHLRSAYRGKREAGFPGTTVGLRVCLAQESASE